ncbi:MAG: SDR family oxidoreductase [Chloroflexi bacterium]|nr:SDR family oxidoreductase [Chloroflexota bacterium]
MNLSMQGKTVLISGATSGIGFIAARELARMGAQTVLVSRNPEKCAASAKQISQETGNQQVDFIAADLSTHAGVQKAANEFTKQHARLDVLLNNAGAMFMSRKLSSDGIEMTLATNHFNYFQLTTLLLDALKASDHARVVNVSSDAHRGSKINFDDIQLAKSYSGFGAYAQSKLANVLFTYELARKLEGTNVTANALHPGFVNTGFGKNNGGLMKFALGLLKPMQRKVEDGASTSVFLASSPAVQGVTGKYFTDSKEVESDPATYDQSAAAKLWNLTLEMMA